LGARAVRDRIATLVASLSVDEDCPRNRPKS
jgi:hypothetical protein